MSRRISFLLLAISALLILPIALLAAGTFVPGIPYLGTIALPHFTGRPSQLLFVVVVGMCFAYAVRRMRAAKLSSALLLIGGITAVGTLVVFISHLHVAWENGASINVPATLLPRNYWEGASPDETVTYTFAGNMPLELDIYRPTNRSITNVPIVMYIHGGGWVGNGRGMQAANLQWFADQGYLAVSPEYVLATPDRPTWNTAWPQMACALAWVAANAEQYGGDPTRIYVFGESAGGALALTTSYAVASGAADTLCDGNIPRVRAVAANVPAVELHSFYNNQDPLLAKPSREMITQYLGGSPEDHPSRVRFVSASTYISPSAPPTMIFLSESDRLVPIEGAHRFISEAKQAGVKMRTIEFPWADHSLSVRYHSVANQTMLQLMLKHFERNGRDTLAPG